MATSVSTWGRESAGYMEEGAFSTLAEEEQTAQLTEHAHSTGPSSSEAKWQVDVV